jgi:hypothetical protein
MPESIQQEAQAILNILASTPFQDCIALSKEFRELPMRAGIYAVKHRTIGILLPFQTLDRPSPKLLNFGLPLLQ